MSANGPLIRSHAVIFVASALLFISVVLIWHGLDRERQYQAAQASLAEAVARGAAGAIGLELGNLQHRLEVFVADYRTALGRLDQRPEDRALHEALERRVSRHFPEYFAFTLTDARGNPRLEDLEGLVGDVCRENLARYANRLETESGHPVSNEVFIHPQPGHYHFDIMAPWSDQQRRGIFFISIEPGALARTLQMYTIPGFDLMLVKQTDPSLIEIAAGGARDRLDRSLRLSDQEQDRVLARQSVAHSLWDVAVIAEPGLFGGYRQHIGRESLLVFLITAVVVIGFGIAGTRIPHEGR